MAAVDIIARGIAASKASLVNGKVPASELPSYVDDVIEVASYADLPDPGESGKIYVAVDTNECYRWSGSEYIEIGGSPSGIPSCPADVDGAYVLVATVVSGVVTYGWYSNVTIKS